MATQKRGDDLKFLSRVEIIGDVRCNVALIMIPWYESGSLLGMIYRGISQFSLAIFVNKDELDGVQARGVQARGVQGIPW